MDYLQYKVARYATYAKYALAVLNLIINGLPSIHKEIVRMVVTLKVLNLIINGLPSILPLS